LNQTSAYLGVFAKFRIETTSFLTSVRMSLRFEQFGF